MPSQYLGVLHFTLVSRLTSTALESTFSFHPAFSSQVSPCVFWFLFLSCAALPLEQNYGLNVMA